LGRSILRGPTGWVLAFLLGWAILRAVALIPIAGGLVWFAAVVFGLGALLVAIWRGRSTRAVPAVGNVAHRDPEMPGSPSSATS
jgi:hypothetical protein